MGSVAPRGAEETAMQWVPDQTGRFPQRPYYRQRELDELCERRIRYFLWSRHGRVTYPVSTDDLMGLIEDDAADLDLCADLSTLPRADGVVHGVTTFYVEGRPRVQIARELILDARRQARLRTTLAHEYGHVLLHNFAQDHPEWRLASRDGSEALGHPALCHPQTVIQPPGTDWMEWQAAYASGALLMPRTAVQHTAQPLLKTYDASIPVHGRTMGRLIDLIQGQFLVSESAAYVRLHQLGYLRRFVPPQRDFGAT